MSETRKIAVIRVRTWSAIAGSPAWTRSNSAATAALRSDLIEPRISADHGRIVKRTGDGSVIEFRSVVDAGAAPSKCSTPWSTNAGVALKSASSFASTLPRRRRRGERRRQWRRRRHRRAAGGRLRAGHDLPFRNADRQVKGRLDLAGSELGPTQLKKIAEPIRVYSVRVGVPAQGSPRNRRASDAMLSEKAFGAHALAAALAALLILIGAARGGFSVRSGLWLSLRERRPRPSALHRRAALHQPLQPSRPYYFADGVTENLATETVAIFQQLRHRRQHRLHLQGQGPRRQAIGKESACATSSKARCSATPPGAGQRPADRCAIRVHLWADRFEDDVVGSVQAAGPGRGAPRRRASSRAGERRSPT